MSIEKMSLMNIVGSLSSLDDTLLKCCQSEVFHPELAEATKMTGNSKGFHPLNEENPYAPRLQKLVEVLDTLSIPLVYRNYDNLNMTEEEIYRYLDQVDQQFTETRAKKSELKDKINNHEQAIIQINHMMGLDANFDDIFGAHHSQARFGRLPYDSYLKLEYFSQKMFFFFPFDHDNDYYWGVYFAPEANKEEVEDIFNSLYFEEIIIPDYAHGTPKLAVKNITNELAQEKELLQAVREQLKTERERQLEKLQMIYSFLKMKADTFSFRKYAVTGYDQFHLEGFVLKKKLSSFMAQFDEMDNVICEVQPVDADARLTPPVKLKTNWLFRPFEMFVTMYGLPGYYDLNPTSFIGFIYVLLFGIMFGDLGQGAVVMIVGIVLWKVKKMQLGAILARCGVSSMIFGTLYGSVFGFEELLTPLYKSVFGLEGKPIEVFHPETTNMLLLAAIGIGVVIIVASISLNIYLGFKRKDYQRAIFSNNGIAGLVLYLGSVIAAVLLMMSGINILSPIFIILVIALPLLCMFLREPLGKLTQRRKDIKPKDGIGGFIIENFFELFEFLLSFVTNTMSFLRVGGFILSHAGMMAVVMTLTEMIGGVGSPIVLIIGNVFVMCLEALLVGIQVLRLVFYETFSRFYDGDGKPFEPAKVEYEQRK